MKLKRFDADTLNEIIKYVLAFVMVILIGAFLVAVQGESPAIAVKALFSGTFGSKMAIGNTLRWSIPCIMTGMAAAVAFKSGVINLGIEGQFYFGALAAAVVGYAVELPAGLHTVVCILAGIAAGVLYALLPALLRLLLKLDEMIVTMMLNYIAILLTEYITITLMGISGSFIVSGACHARLTAVGEDSYISRLTLEAKAMKTEEQSEMIRSLDKLLLVVGIALIYKYTVKGYELKQVGESIRFARVGGVKVTSTFISIFLLSGAISGLGGSVEVLGAYGKFNAGFAGSLGWDGVMIARVAKNNPFVVLLVALLWGMMKAGSLQMERMTDINRLTVTLVQAIFVLFITVDYAKLGAGVKKLVHKIKAKKSVAGGKM